METDKTTIAFEILIILFAIGLGFSIAGGYHTYNLKKHSEIYGMQLDNVLNACKQSYHRDISMSENKDNLVIIIEDKDNSSLGSWRSSFSNG